MIVVRYADDFVLGFEHREDAERFLRALHERLGKFGLALHPDKTRLIEFGRDLALRRRQRGDGNKPETFDFLGFTHISAITRKGRGTVMRQTVAKWLTATLAAIRAGLRERLHDPIRTQGAWLKRVLTGWANYFAVPGNTRRMKAIRRATERLCMQALARRSQRRRVNWNTLRKLARHWLPPLKVLHPWPNVRFDARHPRQEPYAGNPLVRFRAGGAG